MHGGTTPCINPDTAGDEVKNNLRPLYCTVPYRRKAGWDVELVWTGEEVYVT